MSRSSTKTLLALGIAVVLLSCSSFAATFSGNAQVYSGANNALTWDAANGANSALSVSCWFKLAIPSGTNLTEDMTILVNQHGYSPNGAFAYLIRFNVENGNIEFVTRGSIGFSGNMTKATNGPQSYALIYDEDNRTTGITFSNSATATNVTIANRYDALGRRVSRTLNTNRTDYVLDLSGSMGRILCDLDAAGTITE